MTKPRRMREAIELGTMSPPLPEPAFRLMVADELLRARARAYETLHGCKPPRNPKRSVRGLCAHCGIAADGWTHGCNVCWMRHYARRKRRETVERRAPILRVG